LHGRSVVEHKADMAALDAALLIVRHPRQVDELVAHIDKGGALMPVAQVEVEDLAVPFERLVDVADLDRHMVDADEPGLSAVAHIHPPNIGCRHLSPTATLCASGVNQTPYRRGR